MSGSGSKKVCLSLSADDLARFEKIAARLGMGKSKAMSVILRVLVVPTSGVQAEPQGMSQRVSRRGRG